MRRLSRSLDQLKSHYDVVVVGSGYGGGIAASRMARAGRSVCLLERGEERQPGEYPATLGEASQQMQMDTPEGHVGQRSGMFDFHVNRDINVLVGCGLGGTSLINANVSIRPEPRIFDDPSWPVEVRADRHTRLEEGYRHATAMLRPTPYPDDWPALAKTAAHRTSADAMGQPFALTPINVTFEDGVNHVGVEQRRCTLCGDCVTGCNHHAKNTTLMNYLPDAANHGAEIFTNAWVREVRAIRGHWAVVFDSMGDARRRFDAPLLTVEADVVVLAAGALGSTEILLRSRQSGVPASDRLGQRFSGNGDVLGFAYNTADPVHGVGWGHRQPGDLHPVGPCITSLIDIRNQPDLEQGLIIEEGSLPGAMASQLAAPFAAAAAAGAVEGGLRLAGAPRRAKHELESLAGGGHTGSVDRTQTFLIMSHDGSDGRMYLENDRLRIDWPSVGTRPTFTRGDEQMRAATAALDGVYVKNPLWSTLFHHNVISVHPLGGCVMADRAEDGVTNHKGQVFSGTEGDAVHTGLYVCDGAIVPRSLGVNPLLTISALAERACALMAEDRGWTVDYRFQPVEAALMSRLTTGLQFTEKMAGFFSTAVTDSFDAAAARGKSDRSRLEFVLTVDSHDVHELLTAADHPARLRGSVLAPELSPHPITVSAGAFNLFVDNQSHMDERNMRYRMHLLTDEGRALFFDGFKRVRPGSLFNVWPATTTLYVTVHEGDDLSGAVVGRGILRIQPADFVRQLTTMKVTNAPDVAARAEALNGFGRLFAGELWKMYGGALAHVINPGGAPPAPCGRTLAAPEPEVHVFATPDGTELRLVRFLGGTKGPLICAPGFSNSSSVFSLDTIDDSFAEVCARDGYDTWLFDYRASPDLPSAYTQFTIDTIAQQDWPAAVDYVKRVTGRPDVQVVAHCIGSMSCYMALLLGLRGVRQFVSSQLTPHPVVDVRGKLKAGFHLDETLRLMGAAGVTSAAGFGGEIIDRLLALYPIPKDWAGLGPTCRRIYSIYGPVFKPANLNLETADALGQLFGFSNLTAFDQISVMLRKGHAVDAKGVDCYLPEVKRLAFPITIVHGADNVFFRPEGSERTYQWLRQSNGTELYRRFVIPGYSHLDCFIGKHASRDVFPTILQELARFN